jgi:carbamoyl-phosphate synthase large subunit
VVSLYHCILITSCGGDIGLNLGRLLRGVGIARTLVGVSPHEDHPGTCVFDACEILPPAEHPDYFPALQTVAERHQADLLVPTSEAEIALFTREGISQSLGDCPVLIVNPRAVDVGLDKLATAIFLRDQRLAAPWTVRVAEYGPPEVPCVLKPRVGNEGRGFLLIPDRELARYCLRGRPDDLWQELLLPDDQEFTCGLYRSPSVGIRTISIRRRLRGGSTLSGVVVRDDRIDEYLHRIAEGLDLRGSINVQLRLTERGPVAFDINPRFSSTVVFRHRLGFQDLLWSLRERCGVPAGAYQGAREGTRIYRGATEYVVAGAVRAGWH